MPHHHENVGKKVQIMNCRYVMMFSCFCFFLLIFAGCKVTFYSEFAFTMLIFASSLSLDFFKIQIKLYLCFFFFFFACSTLHTGLMKSSRSRNTPLRCHKGYPYHSLLATSPARCLLRSLRSFAAALFWLHARASAFFLEVYIGSCFVWFGFPLTNCASLL